MIKRAAKVVLGTFGLQITRVPKQDIKRLLKSRDIRRQKEEIVKALATDPLNSILHLQYADYASKVGNIYLAYAELKTAQTLGADAQKVQGKMSQIRESLPDPKRMNHNLYFRLISLATEVLHRAGASSVSVLDVGGGNGELASFLPDASYCLAEPTVNGISGTNLPFSDHSYDYVVSCHVLEHVPVEERTAFLDQLMLKAKRGVILLNPFFVEGVHLEERLKLVIKLTNANWAKEHLECTLPRVIDIENFARERGLEIHIRPNGTSTVSLAFVFLDYFAARSGVRNQWEEVNWFFNERYTPILDSREYPNAYLIFLCRPQASRTS